MLGLFQVGLASCSTLKATKLFRVKLQESRNNFLWPKDIICIIAGLSLNLVLLHSVFFTRLGKTSWEGNGRHMGVCILSLYSLFRCLPFSLNLEAKYVSFEEQLGCRNNYCFIQLLHYFSTQPSPGRPWRLKLPEHYR